MGELQEPINVANSLASCFRRAFNSSAQAPTTYRLKEFADRNDEFWLP